MLRPTPPEAPKAARTALSVVLLAVMYLWIFPYHSAVNNPNENVRIYMTVAVVDDGTFAINRIEQLWGYTNDKSIRDGRLYSSKAPGTSYLGVPFYWALTKITGRNTRPAPTPAVTLPPTAVVPGAAAPSAAPATPPATARPAAVTAPREPLDRTRVTYFLRLFTNVLPALLFAWFWHRFLGARTRSATLREAVFFSTMVGSSLFAYSEVFAGHAHNAYCFAAALMALATVQRRDLEAAAGDATGRHAWGLMFLAGLFGAGITLFEYPAATASIAVALWIAALCAERRRHLLPLAAALLGLAVALAVKHHKLPAALAGLGAVVAYGLTLSPRSLGRLALAGLGGAIPTGLTLFYHKRCFGSPFKPGYSYLENATFREETSQGFFGATQFSWEAGLRLWFDPAFGLVPSTALFVVAFLGLGAYLRPAWLDGPMSASARLRRDLASGILGFVALGALVKVVLVAKAHAVVHEGLHAAMGPWVTMLALTAVALGALQLPSPPRHDRAMGPTMALATLLLTHLIGMMNNWRGGWQVGPRYLVTLVPVLGLAALATLDGLLPQHPGQHPALVARRAAVTLFAAGATLSAMLVTGMPSMLFPHLPVEYTAPFFEMVVPLLRGGFVPHNAGHLLGLKGLASMGVFFAAMGAAAVMVAKGDTRRPLPALAHGLAACAVTLLLLIPMALAVKPENVAVTRYVQSAFEPQRPVPPPSTNVPPAQESPTAARARARRLADQGDPGGALAAWLRAFRAP
jgi:hypothetical protein